MDTNDKPDLAGKYAGKPFAALIKPELSKTNKATEPDDQEDDAEPGYRALVQHRDKKGSAPRFLIIDRTGQSWGCGYAYLLGWLFSPPDTLSVNTTTHSFILTGKNLHTIQNALMRERVKYLREFNPKTDDKPADGEPFIEHLTVKTRLEQS